MPGPRRRSPPPASPRRPAGRGRAAEGTPRGSPSGSTSGSTSRSTSGSTSGSLSGSGRLSTDRRAAALYLKVALFARELEKVDWLLWLDLDVFILELLRPLERFTGLLEARGGLYHVRLPGESCTRRVARYQFSNYAYLVRNSPVGRAFAAAQLRSVTAIVQGCENSHLPDQKVCPTR